MNDTRYTQPALLLTSVALWLRRVPKTPSQKPSVFLGHSIGEYAALVACGALDFEEAMRLVNSRAYLMSQCEQPAGTAMVAVNLRSGSQKELRSRFAELNVDLAGVNSSKQIVLSGLLADIEKALGLMGELVARKTRLKNVSHPFHSRFMLPAAIEYAKVLEKTKFKPFEGIFVSNVTGRPVTHEELPSLLARQITSTVRWWDSIKWVIDNDSSTRLLEVGPGRVLSGLLAQDGIRVTNGNDETDTVEKNKGQASASL